MSLPSNINSIRKNSVHIDEGIKDVRFITAASRPQFRNKHKSDEDELININKTDDERFQSMYTDSKFQIPGTSLEEDKYGRKQKKKKEKKKKDDFVKKSSATTDEEDDQVLQSNNKAGEEKEADDRFSTNHLSLIEDNKTAKQQEKGEIVKKMDPITLPKDAEARIAYLTALSRGEIDNSSATSSSFEDSDDMSSNSSYSGFSGTDEEDAHNIMGPDDEQVDITYESSPYLAICNLDWRHVRAVDIFVILGSFCNSNDDVKSVKIYTSNFGKEQLEKEQIYGPPAGIFLKKKRKHSTGNDSTDDDDDDASTTASDVEPEYRSDDEEEIEHNVYKNFPHQASALETIDEEDVMDVEKLRAYERSKLKYYFAVAEFRNSDSADKVYKELDGMEFENSSASFDLRSLSKGQISSEIKEEDMKDECYGIPYEYQPPRFVVEALQHTSVKCTWDETSDKERERKLTQFFGVNKDAWNAMVEGDDLKAYLASDASSSSDEEEGTKNQQKSSQLRKLLGLDKDDDDNDDDNSNNQVNSSTSNSSDSEEEDSEEEDDEEKEAVVQIGEPDLASKIRSKIEQNRNEDQTTKIMTPWEKYQQKRKEKRKEKRQRRKDGNNNIVSTEDDGMYDQDPEMRHEDYDSSNEEDFFVEENGTVEEHEIHPSRPEVQKKNSKTKITNDETSAAAVHTSRTASTKEELELLLAGDDGQELEKDFDMRGLVRLQQESKKAKKKRPLDADLAGTEFQINLKDGRFSSMLDGTDARFGIDPTDPNFKSTPAMKTILSEQSKRRREKNNIKHNQPTVGNVGEQNDLGNGGEVELNSLVTSIKRKVKNKKGKMLG